MGFVLLAKEPLFLSSGDMRPLAADGGGLQPRPKTTAMVARRFVCNALGVRVNISKEQRDKERRELTEAKEQRGVEGKGRRVKEVEAGGERKEEAVVAVSASKEQREVEEDKEKGVREEGGADKNEEQELGEAKVASKEQGELMKPKALSKELAGENIVIPSARNMVFSPFRRHEAVRIKTSSEDNSNGCPQAGV